MLAVLVPLVEEHLAVDPEPRGIVRGDVEGVGLRVLRDHETSPAHRDEVRGVPAVGENGSAGVKEVSIHVHVVVSSVQRVFVIFWRVSDGLRCVGSLFRRAFGTRELYAKNRTLGPSAALGRRGSP